MPSISKSGLKLINKDTLWDKAYLSLRNALLAGKFVPGERIILRKVAQDLGISLTPVRDAVNRLAAENVLERGGVGQGGGASVPLLNAKEFDQLMAIRSSLEPLAAEAAAKTAHTAKADGYLLCKAQDKVAAHVQRTNKAKAGKPLATPPCADPGKFVYTPPEASPTATAPAATPAATSAPAATPAPPIAIEPNINPVSIAKCLI